MSLSIHQEEKVQCHWLGRVPYQEALALQNDLAEQVLSGQAPETILLLEHDPVYTIGRGKDQSSLLDLLENKASAPVEIINRGGQATYHGPGQLVGYFILDLRGRGRDLHAHLRLIEQSIISALGRYQLTAHRHESLTGAWVDNRKVASIGVGVRRWISMHGCAINITEDSLAGFNRIIPCGLAGVEMTCVNREIPPPGTSVAEFAEILAEVCLKHTSMERC